MYHTCTESTSIPTQQLVKLLLGKRNNVKIPVYNSTQHRKVVYYIQEPYTNSDWQQTKLYSRSEDRLELLLVVIYFITSIQKNGIDLQCTTHRHTIIQLELSISLATISTDKIAKLLAIRYKHTVYIGTLQAH